MSIHPRYLLALIVLISLAFWASALSFSPVPWPDDAAFFLPALDLAKWPPVYRMHAQAPFVPTYDIANFNTMPLLPILLAIGKLAGIATDHGIRIFGIIALGAWAWLLVLWMQKRGLSTTWIWLITLAALLSPTIRWGATVVRTEVWVGLLWTPILMELDGFFKKKNVWRLPVFLALSAYTHFEAIVWVTPVAVGILFKKGDFKTNTRLLFGVGLRTLALLSPWILYGIWHWKIFWIQMDTQFGRLDIPQHPFMHSAYSVFHSLFISLGSPVSFPKFFNFGKFLTWGVLLFSFFKNIRPKNLSDSVTIASAVGLVSTFYLCYVKPEVWFTTLIHMSLWPMVIATVTPSAQNWNLQRTAAIPNPSTPPRSGSLRMAAQVCLGTLVFFQAALAIHQWWKIKNDYSWARYRDWVDCIDNTIGQRQRIWQPQWPDVLVELSGRNPKRDYTRAVDFEGIDHLLKKHAESSEVIIHSWFWGLEEPISKQDYSGNPRIQDIETLTDHPWLQFKQFNALKMNEGTVALGSNKWYLKICQRGPLWAALTMRELSYKRVE
jgi:hypothetical protein